MNNNKGDVLCVWTGPATIILFGIGFVGFVGWVPPPPPSLSATEVVDVYQRNLFGIRFGMMLTMFCGVLNLAFSAVVTKYMLRMKGSSSTLAYTQLLAGALNALLFVLPAVMFSAVAYRPDRLAEITQFGNDQAWLILDMTSSPAIIQFIALGLAILWDESKRPVFPRWMGYYSFWAALLMVPAALEAFFKTGPFTWSGMLAFYLAAAVFCVWYFLMPAPLLRAIRESGEGNDAA